MSMHRCNEYFARPERLRGKVIDNPAVERRQSGKFIVVDCGRADSPPREMFPDE